jgi:hypothetical protein
MRPVIDLEDRAILDRNPTFKENLLNLLQTDKSAESCCIAAYGTSVILKCPEMNGTVSIKEEQFDRPDILEWAINALRASLGSSARTR